MSYNETIDNYLYDEENEYTQANNLWEDFFMEKQDKIDERPWIQAAEHHLRPLHRLWGGSTGTEGGAERGCQGAAVAGGGTEDQERVWQERPAARTELRWRRDTERTEQSDRRTQSVRKKYQGGTKSLGKEAWHEEKSLKKME